MSEFETEKRLGKPRKFSKYRCVKCKRYLVPLTEEKMDLFDFTLKQREEVREYQLTHFCPFCMRGYQREEKPLSEESANCPYCGEELAFLTYEGELTDVLWCEECEKPFLAEGEELKKIQRYAQKIKGE